MDPQGGVPQQAGRLVDAVLVQQVHKGDAQAGADLPAQIAGADPQLPCHRIDTQLFHVADPDDLAELLHIGVRVFRQDAGRRDAFFRPVRLPGRRQGLPVRALPVDFLPDLFHHGPQLVLVHRLQKIIGHPQLEGPLCQVELRIAGKHDAGKAVDPHRLLQHIQPGHPGHQDVGDDQVRLLVTDDLQALLPVRGGAHHHTAHFQPVDGKDQPLADDFLVLYHNDLQHSITPFTENGSLSRCRKDQGDGRSLFAAFDGQPVFGAVDQLEPAAYIVEPDGIQLVLFLFQIFPEPAQQIRRDAHPVVTDPEIQVLPLKAGGDLHRDVGEAVAEAVLDGIFRQRLQDHPGDLQPLVFLRDADPVLQAVPEPPEHDLEVLFGKEKLLVQPHRLAAALDAVPQQPGQAHQHPLRLPGGGADHPPDGLQGVEEEVGVELGLEDLHRCRQVLPGQGLVADQQVADAPQHDVEGVADMLELVAGLDVQGDIQVALFHLVQGVDEFIDDERLFVGHVPRAPVDGDGDDQGQGADKGQGDHAGLDKGVAVVKAVQPDAFLLHLPAADIVPAVPEAQQALPAPQLLVELSPVVHKAAVPLPQDPVELVHHHLEPLLAVRVQLQAAGGQDKAAVPRHSPPAGGAADQPGGGAGLPQPNVIDKGQLAVPGQILRLLPPGEVIGDKVAGDRVAQGGKDTGTVDVEEVKIPPDLLAVQKVVDPGGHFGLAGGGVLDRAKVHIPAELAALLHIALEQAGEHDAVPLHRLLVLPCDLPDAEHGKAQDQDHQGDDAGHQRVDDQDHADLVPEGHLAFRFHGQVLTEKYIQRDRPAGGRSALYRCGRTRFVS